MSGIEPSGVLTQPDCWLGRKWYHYNAQPAAYDVVTVLDVVEHVPEAAAFLRALAYHVTLYDRLAMDERARRSGFRVVSSEHRSRRMPLDYLWKYAMDFLLASRHHSGGRRQSRFAVPVNLGDTLYVVWERT